MKKIILCFLILLCLCGCEKKGEEKKEKPDMIKPIPEEIIPTYEDLNTTPISFYQLSGNVLNKVEKISGNYQKMDDVLFLQVYPSNENQVVLNSSFGSSYQRTWEGYKEKLPIKEAFQISFETTAGEKISYFIYSPNETMEKWQYFMAYLYDDYANQGKGFYSHMESNEFTENSYVTAFKLQCGDQCSEIHSPVQLTVFTYDSEDDFLEGSYRGNSKSTINICLHGDC